jgi:ATP-dependent Clp protease ATP-binding subunit ClpA
MTTKESKPVIVNTAHVTSALSAWTGIPADRLQAGRMDPSVFKALRQRLTQQVLGQDLAVEAAIAGLERRYQLPERTGHKRPVWTSLFAGRSGVGKTELARRLAEEFFGHASALIRIDCSELTDEHHAARLVGSPPGYVGHGQPGQLVAGLERCGYGTVLLDEVEKAHPSILTSVVLPLIGDGEVHDMGSGRALDASNTVVIMTTNLGVSRGSEAAVGFLQEQVDDAPAQERQIRNAIEAHFPHEVLGRIDDVIVFSCLDRETVDRIWEREVSSLETRLAARGQAVRIRIQPDARELLIDCIADSQRSQGARAILRLFDKAVADRCLALLGQGAPGPVIISIEKTPEGGLRYRLVPAEGRKADVAAEQTAP